MTEKQPLDHAGVATAVADSADTQSSGLGATAARNPAHVRVPEFTALNPASAGAGSSPVSRFYDVDVTVWAEIGRLTLPLRELMQLGEGSVVELKRQVSAPVDLMAQGVRVASGELVVVDDCFALRITEIENPDDK